MFKYLKIIAVVFYISLLISSSFGSFGEQQFSYLSRSFLVGKLDVNGYPYGFADASFYGGNYYWPLGPFPGILITPLVFAASYFNTLFLHRYIHWILVTCVFFLVYKIARRLKFNETDSILCAFAFNLGSVFIGVSLIPWSWYYAQVVCTLLIFLAIYEYLNNKRYFILGLIFSCIFLTRITATLGVIFVILDILHNKEVIKSKIIKIVKLTTPIVASVIMLLAYNYLRFGNPFEQGYKYQIISGGTDKARNYGLLSFRHVPGNLYYFLIASPDQVLKDGQLKVLKFPFITYNDWGMGIVFTSCYFLLLPLTGLKTKTNRNLLLTSLAISVPIFMYYGIGFRQYGYRYSLDFLPYLFLILLLHYSKTGLTIKFRMMVFLSIFLNIYLLFFKGAVI